VFGRACRSPEELAKAIEESYGRPQSDEDIARYRKIVEFHDGRNSERIIGKLKMDKII